MRIVDIPIQSPDEAIFIEQQIEHVCAEYGLSITLKTSLKQYPGSKHWHVKRGRETGILEITLWAKQGKAWFSVHDNRTGAWVEAAIQNLLQRLETL